jgi:hypothetical protein
VAGAKAARRLPRRANDRLGDCGRRSIFAIQRRVHDVMTQRHAGTSRADGPSYEFRRHADECRKMARSTAGVELRAVWQDMAVRWGRCADLADSETVAAHTVARAQRVRHRTLRILRRPDDAA